MCVCVFDHYTSAAETAESIELSQLQRLPAVVLCGEMNDVLRFYFRQMSAAFFIFYSICLETGGR